MDWSALRFVYDTTLGTISAHLEGQVRYLADDGVLAVCRD